jgi:hypothetical protein
MNEIACRACGCTERSPCPGGCGWAEGLGDLCTAYEILVAAFVELADTIGRGRFRAVAAEAIVWMDRGARVVGETVDGALILATNPPTDLVATFDGEDQR